MSRHRTAVEGASRVPFELVCPVTGEALSDDGETLRTASGATYPRIGGVAVLVDGVAIKPRRQALTPAVIEQLAAALAVPATRQDTLAAALRFEFTFAEDWIQIEADQFLNRVAASHAGLHHALTKAEQAAPRRSASSRTWAAVRRWRSRPQPDAAEPARDLIPHLSCLFQLTKMRVRRGISINVRLENRGTAALSSCGPHPFRLSYYWHDAEGVRSEGKRTDLLTDLLPGRTMSVPLFIDPLERSGRYRLTIAAVEEGLRWIDESQIEFEVEVGPGASTADPPRWRRTRKRFDYRGDHLEGIRLLELWRERLFERPVERIVELGGNSNPMIEHVAAAHKINVDIDPYGMIVGKLVREGQGGDVTYVVADGMRLPFAARSIDMLVMFATFHHFPDPIALLARLAEFVADDGLICLLCEPIGHVHPETVSEEYLEELRRGVNEQSFELWEYAQMFEAAGLAVAAAQIDVGSAKFALRPRRA